MTIGPENERREADVFAVRVTLHSERTGSLTTPPLVLVTEPSITETRLEYARISVSSPLGEQCPVEYLADVDAFIDQDALVSPAVEEWLAGLRSMKN